MRFCLVPYCLRIPNGLIVSDWDHLISLFQSILLNWMLPRLLARVVDGLRAHRHFGVKFATRGSATWVFIRTWNAGEFVRVAVAIIDRFYGDANSELAFLGKILSAVGSGASRVSLSGGSNTLVECYRDYLGSGYMKTLADFPIFDVRLLKRCLQKTASVVFGTLDRFSMTQFIVTRLKGAEHRDWMQSRQSLRLAIGTGDLSLPGLWMLSVTSLGR